MNEEMSSLVLFTQLLSNQRKYIQPFKYEAQTDLFKDPVRTAL